jgi:hypothetical protein
LGSGVRAPRVEPVCRGVPRDWGMKFMAQDDPAARGDGEHNGDEGSHGRFSLGVVGEVFEKHPLYI